MGEWRYSWYCTNPILSVFLSYTPSVLSITVYVPTLINPIITAILALLLPFDFRVCYDILGFRVLLSLAVSLTRLIDF